MITSPCLDTKDRACDACRPERPVDAIFPADDVPADQQDFIEVDRFVFADISG